METWVKVWREGIAPQLSTPGLEALRKALVEDDPRLIQGATTTPPPLIHVQDWDVEAACPIGYCGWQGDGEERNTVAGVEAEFARVCFECDQTIGEPAGCRHFLNWVDDTPRAVMIRELLPEVEAILRKRHDQEEERPDHWKFRRR